MLNIFFENTIKYTQMPTTQLVVNLNHELLFEIAALKKTAHRSVIISQSHKKTLYSLLHKLK